MSGASEAISGVGAIASAFGGGGSSGGGGAVVGGPSPSAALLAGQYQVQAAKAAADAARQSVNDAINSINQHYTQARYDVQPYRTAGVQALDQLNQYLQLSPYNPGAAPTAPKKYTGADVLDQITKDQIRSNILMNTTQTVDDKGFQHATYAGTGVDALRNTTTDTPYGDSSGSFTFAGNTEQGYTGMRFINNPILQDAVRQELADELANQKNQTFDTQVADYNRNLEEWQQNKNWYDQYTTEGPLTSAQITDKISNLPGYQTELQQGADAINKTASARGYLGSGRILQELSAFGQNTLSKYYNNTLDRLSQIASNGQQAASSTAQVGLNQGNNIAQLQAGLGDTIANSRLAAGNAQAQGILAANQQYQVIGGGGGGK